jgi:hypothetical protein
MSLSRRLLKRRKNACDEVAYSMFRCSRRIAGALRPNIRDESKSGIQRLLRSKADVASA